jgi:hypothetical protein
MATLNGQQISATYGGLIKTANNQAGAPFPPAKLQYGDGTELPISIGDGTGVGIGDIVTIASGTRQIDINSQNLSLTGISQVSALAGTCNISDGTYEFGLPFPGAPATNVDFTNATVTGLTDNNTTYDLASAQNAANVDVTLTGSDATTDTVTLAAGTNITLTDNGSNQITINAAGGGGGSAGLESGTGTDSMQSAASLTTTPADAQSARSIVLGNGAVADATGNEQVVIGNSARADHEKTVAIGDNAQGHYQAVAIGRNSVAGTSSNKGGCIAIGNTANADTQDDAIAIGSAASAQALGAVALGRNVSATITDTVSVKALEVQTDSTPTAGGIILSDASGTDQRLNVTSDGNLQLGTTRMGIVGWSTNKLTETQATSSCDTTRASVLIPAGTVKAGDILQIKSLEQRSGSTGATYSNLAIHTSGTIGQTQSGAFCSGHQSSNDGFGVHSKNLFVQTVDGTGDGTIYLEDGYTPQEQQGGIFSSNLSTQTAIDWTVDQYLCVNICIDNSGTTWTNYGASITIIGRN